MLAAGAVLFNTFLLPGVGARLYRPGDHHRSLHGIVLLPDGRPVALAALPAEPALAAAAWGVLAAGDGMATIVGRAVGGPRWPWNREKTVAGTAALALWPAGRPERSSCGGAASAAPAPLSLGFIARGAVVLRPRWRRRSRA